MKTISLYLFIALSPFFSFAQVFQCGDGWSNHMEVNASSGLKLRAEPNLESQTLAIVPVESIIPICYPSTLRATIDGIKGKWVMAEYQGQRGYVFDGYLEGVATEPPFAAECITDFVNSWEETSFRKDVNYMGLYKGEVEGEFEIKPLSFKENGDEKFFKGSTDQEIPIWLFLRNTLSIEGKLKGKVLNKQLHLDERIQLDHAAIFADGGLTIYDREAYNTQFTPYELRAISKNKDKYINQLLISSEHYSKLGYVMVRFIGDLDRDGIDDLILTYSMEGKAWDHVLASSRYAAPDQLYRTFHIGGGSD